MKKQYRSNFDPLVDAYLEVYNRSANVVNEAPSPVMAGQGSANRSAKGPPPKVPSNPFLAGQGSANRSPKPTPNVPSTPIRTGSGGGGTATNKPTPQSKTDINLDFDSMKAKTHPLSDKGEFDIESPIGGAGIRG